MKRKINFLIYLLITLLIVVSFTGCNLKNDINSSESTSSKGNEFTSDASIENETSNNNLDAESSDSFNEEPITHSSVSFLACPDNLIHPCIYYDAIERAAKNNNTKPSYKDLHNAKYDFSPIYKNVKDIIANADIAYLNQESLIGGNSGSVHGYPCFNTPNVMGETVIDVGFDIINVAHNHMLDSGNTNFLTHCNDFFESRNVDVLGCYPNDESTNNITIIEKNNIKIAFLTYTYSTNGITLDSNNPFVIPFFDETLIRKQVKLAKENADFIIVSCHWGNENTHTLNSFQKNQAEFLCELDVDLVLGMHPHCIQPMEWKTSPTGKKILVVYSLGNFVSGMDRGINNLGCMLSLEIQKDLQTNEISIIEPQAIPFVNHYTKSDAVASDDKGYRNYEVYLLKEYTEELAKIHGAHSYEAQNGTTLEGGAFSKQNLLNTFYKYIPAEFYYPIS